MIMKRYWIPALAAIAIFCPTSEARGFRGGGFGGQGQYMGSVRYGNYYAPRSYHPYDDAARTDYHNDYAYHAPIARADVDARPAAWGDHITQLPAGYQRRWWRNGWWYYGAGMWYVQNDNEYVATQPPLGMIVQALPDGAVRQTINGQTYYSYDGVWFKPMWGGSQSLDPAPVTAQRQTKHVRCDALTQTLRFQLLGQIQEDLIGDVCQGRSKSAGGGQLRDQDGRLTNDIIQE
jgi:hypothetical protein